MDRTGYTKGPWHVGLVDETSVLSADRETVALCCDRYEDDPERKAADARLIAAAPDLVEALRALVADREEVAKYSWKTWMGGEWHWNDEIWERNDPDEFKLIKAARAALSKALGEGMDSNG